MAKCRTGEAKVLHFDFYEWFRASSVFNVPKKEFKLSVMQQRSARLCLYVGAFGRVIDYLCVSLAVKPLTPAHF